MTTFRLTTNASNNKVQDKHKFTSQKRHLVEAEEEQAVDDHKPKRKRISPEQFCLLTELFQQTDTPSHELREKLAKKLKMTNREVQVWFQNRRAKVNRSRIQEQEDIANKRVKFNYWSTTTTPAATRATSNSSSLTSSPSLLPHDLIFHPDVTPIDILATAAAYVQKWDENEQQKKLKEQQVTILEPKKKSWRPWL